MWQDFTEYLLKEAESNPVKMAEVGIGKFGKVAEALSKNDN